jgi:hypothetical protein
MADTMFAEHATRTGEGNICLMLAESSEEGEASETVRLCDR